MQYFQQDGLKALITLVKNALTTKQNTIKTTGLLKGDGDGNITSADTEVATLIDIPTGILKGDGETITSAVAGSDYLTQDDIPVQSVDGNTGTVTTNAVKFVSQTLTTSQKAIARTNIGAGTSSFSGSYNDLTNQPTIPTVNDATLTIQKNGIVVDSFTANASTNKTINITMAKGDVDLDNVDNVKQYSASNPPPYPVTSVNGATGAVTINTLSMVVGTTSGSANIWFDTNNTV